MNLGWQESVLDRQLTRSHRIRLSAALKELPAEIVYLREAILSIAEEDQDLLGSGEADLTPLVEALKQHGDPANLAATAATAAAAADMLDKWIESFADRNAAWAAPLVFAEGALRRIEFFDIFATYSGHIRGHL